jgi:hypothetical protein
MVLQIFNSDKFGELNGKAGIISRIGFDQYGVSGNPIAEFDTTSFSEHIAVFYDPVKYSLASIFRVYCKVRPIGYMAIAFPDFHLHRDRMVAPDEFISHGSY